MPHMSNLPWLMIFTICFMMMMTFIATYNFKQSLPMKKKSLINQDKAKNQWLW